MCRFAESTFCGLIAMKKLNLGCGEFKKAGYVNVDFYSVTEPDVRHNMEIFPYPFSDNEFDIIEMDHVLEHLSDPFSVLKEVHRISKQGGMVLIKVPHFSRGFTHPQHKCGFDVTLPFYFSPEFVGGYQGVEFCIKKLNLNWFAQPYLKKLYIGLFKFNALNTISKVLNYLANLNPFFCSRIWCYWVGGFEEIEYHFETRK